MYKTTALNTLKKTPSKESLQRYKMSGYVMLLIGIVMIIITLLGGLKGV
jgi:preprotein translocase subunit Sss1